MLKVLEAWDFIWTSHLPVLLKGKRNIAKILLQKAYFQFLRHIEILLFIVLF